MFRYFQLLITLFVCLSCKTSVPLTIDDITPGKSQTAILGTVISYEKPTVLVKISKSRQGGNQAKNFMTDAEEKFVVTSIFERFYEDNNNISVDEVISVGQPILFSCEYNDRKKHFQITNIIQK